MALKWLFFSKNDQKFSRGWKLHSQTPVYDALELHHFAQVDMKLMHLQTKKFLTFGLSSLSPLSKILVQNVYYCVGAYRCPLTK